MLSPFIVVTGRFW